MLYLLHGAGDNERGWSTIGRANVIMDNLLAEEKAVPMIIVMPDGHASRAEGVENPFEKDMITDIIPYVEKHYRVYTDSEHRALAGLSMGGFQTLDIGIKHLDMFDWLGLFSSAVRDTFEDTHGALLFGANDNLRLFWIAIGKTDFLYERNMQLLKLLKKRNVRYSYRESEGGHEWKNWRLYLYEFIPLLFK